MKMSGEVYRGPGRTLQDMEARVRDGAGVGVGGGGAP